MARTKRQKKKPEDNRNSPSSLSKGFLTVVAIALLFRILFLQANLDKDWPYSIFYYGDSAHYHEYAVSLIQGKQYDNGIPYHPPLYAWLLAGLYKIKGIPESSGYFFKVCMAVLNSLTIGLSWIWFRKILKSPWNLLATTILILHFGWLVFSATFNNEVIYLLFLILTVLFTLSSCEKPSWLSFILLGFVMGFGSLARAEHLSLWPFLLIYFLRYRYVHEVSSYQSARWGAAILVSLLILFPWSVRNYRALSGYNDRTPGHEPLPVFTTVSAYGPVNFALANNGSSDGGFNPHLVNQFTGGSSIDLTLPDHRYYFIHGYKQGLSWIVSNKIDFLVLLGRKFQRWSDGLALGFGVSDFPGGLKGSRPPVDMFVPDHRILKWPLLALLLVGCIFSFQKEYTTFWLCSLILVHRLIVTLLFFGYARSMIVMLPVVVPLLLLPLIILSERKFPVLKNTAAYGFGIFAALLLLQSLAAAIGPSQDYMSSGSVDERGKIIQDARVEIWPK